ncbi:MAG: nucleotidyltransferase domain-containing protein [Candidatus Cloacimonetes bacterium]|nr:nucleotidyltransferase domain-containing protein [Candidatus Cloacimonadota bacterium]
MKNKELIKNSDLKELIEDFKVLISQELKNKLKTIILYGSYARNEQSDDSDLDLAVIYDSELGEKEKKKVADISCELSLKYDILLSIIYRSKKDFDEYSKFVPFYQVVNKQGIVIYG